MGICPFPGGRFRPGGGRLPRAVRLHAPSAESIAVGLVAPRTPSPLPHTRVARAHTNTHTHTRSHTRTHVHTYTHIDTYTHLYRCQCACCLLLMGTRHLIPDRPAHLAVAIQFRATATATAATAWPSGRPYGSIGHQHCRFPGMAGANPCLVPQRQHQLRR